MSLPDLTFDDQMDYPKAVRDSVTILPFHTGGEVTLAVAATPQDLVLVSALRRFENTVNVASGTHTGGAGDAVLTDAAGDFVNRGVQVGDRVNNTPDVSTAIITAVTATTVTGVLAGGGSNDWQIGEAYTIDKLVSHQSARASQIRKVRIIPSLDTYIRLDGEASAGTHTFRLNTLEAMNEDGIRVVSRISFVNVNAAETPVLRFYTFGV